MAINYRSSMARYRRYVQDAEANPTLRAGFFALFTLSLLIIMVVFALRPTLITIASLLSQINQARDISAQLDSKIASVQRVAELMSLNRDNLQLLNQALPIDAAWSDWTTRVEALASESGVVLQSLGIGPATVVGKETVAKNTNPYQQTISELPKGVVGIPFSITVAGDYEQIKNYDSSLSKLRRVAYISEVLISKKAEDTQMSGTINGYINYMPSLPIE